MTSSPTPAVLPDARARLQEAMQSADQNLVTKPSVTVLANLLSLGAEHQRPRSKQYARGEYNPELDAEFIVAAIEFARCNLATPPASDAAVPAGFVLVPAEATDEMIAAGYGERGNLHPADSYRRMLAAAPKVASDTGAGLLRTISRAIHEHLSRRDIMQYLDNEEDCEGLARAVIAALATPTDATDGATGGVAAARDIRAAMHRSLRSGHKQAHMNYGPLTVCLDAIDAALATTPGGDFLEQAARQKVEWLFDQAFADGVAAGKSGDDSILAGSSSAYTQAAIRALKPAGDGGEA
jgi:hypothetical protein